MFKTETDLLNGNILKSLLLFTVPLVISNIFQQFYSTADIVIVGYFLGEASIAAIGASVVIFDLLLGFAIGVGGGFGIVAAKCYGAGDHDLLKRSVAGAFVSGILLTVFISVIAGLLMMPLLKALNTPIDIIDESYSYISVLVAFTIVLFIYNLCAGLLRAIGNSTIPLLFLIVSSMLNVGFDILFIAKFGMGVQGAAAATVTAQGISAALCLIYIFKKCPMLVPNRKHFRYNAELYKELLGQGLSMGFMMSIVFLSTLILQRAINELGYLIIAGHMTARKISGFFMTPVHSIAVALSTFVSQNKGANRLDRIRKVVRYGNIVSAIWGIFITIILIFSSAKLMKLLSGSDESVIIENGAQYLIVNASFFIILGMLMNSRLALQGIGEKIVPLVSSIMELAGKIIFAFLIIPAIGYIGVIFCEPVMWCFMTLQLLYSFYTNPYIKGKSP